MTARASLDWRFYCGFVGHTALLPGSEARKRPPPAGTHLPRGTSLPFLLHVLWCRGPCLLQSGKMPILGAVGASLRSSGLSTGNGVMFGHVTHGHLSPTASGCCKDRMSLLTRDLFPKTVHVLVCVYGVCAQTCVHGGVCGFMGVCTWGCVGAWACVHRCVCASVWVWVWVMDVCVHGCGHLCTYMCASIGMCGCVWVHGCVCGRVCTDVCTGVGAGGVHGCVGAHMCVCMHGHVCMWGGACMGMCACANMYVCFKPGFLWSICEGLISKNASLKRWWAAWPAVL